MANLRKGDQLMEAKVPLPGGFPSETMIFLFQVFQGMPKPSQG
jgi:hypothetical protein